MSTALTLALPDTVTSRVIVVGDQYLKDPFAAVRDRLTDPWTGDDDQPLRHHAMELLGTTAVQVRLEADPIPELSEISGCCAAERRFITTAAFCWTLTCHTPLSAQPQHDQAVRVIARALADEVGGLVVDLPTGQVLEPHGFEYEPDRWVLGRSWCLLRSSAERVRTQGLSRYGLPELCAEGFPPRLELAVNNLLRALALRLVEDHWAWIARNPGHHARRQSDTVELCSADLWRFWGARPFDTGSLPVRLAQYGDHLLAVPAHGWNSDLTAVLPALIEAASW